MIRNDPERRDAAKRLEQGRSHLDRYRRELEGLGYGPEEVALGIAPLLNSVENLAVEIDRYDSLKRGALPRHWGLDQLGCLLIESRIAAGLSQRALAAKIGCHESQVSRDERNSYHGVTLDRARQILEAIGVQATFLAEGNWARGSETTGPLGLGGAPANPPGVLLGR
jgi:hypothetical protein